MSSRLVGVAAQIMVMAILVSIVILFVGIGVLVLMHVCIVGRAFRRGLSTMTRGDRCLEASSGLSPDDLRGLPSYDFTAGEKATDCAVCLESFQAGERCRLLPLCNHSFHQHCVDSWLSRAPICPICRTSVDHHLRGPKAAESRQGEVIAGVGFQLRESPQVVIGFPVVADPSPFHASASQ